MEKDECAKASCPEGSNPSLLNSSLVVEDNNSTNKYLQGKSVTKSWLEIVPLMPFQDNGSGLRQVINS